MIFRTLKLPGIALLLVAAMLGSASADDALRAEAAAKLKQAAGYYVKQVATHGGYVYHYSPDLSVRWGEGPATADQIWVQPPGTPTVGLALLRAYEATGDRDYLEAAEGAAKALIHGQLTSGGWTNVIDFDPQGKRRDAYRNGRGTNKGRGNSTFDDGISQSAIRLLMHVDRALEFKHAAIHEAAEFALNAVLAAQFANGAFPQVWTGPVSSRPIVKPSYPDYEWRTEGRIKNYWDMYTLNDNNCGYIADMLIDAHRIYGGDRYKAALARLGDFFILAQMPDPQPAWCQQYNYQMQPIWARKFEPPGVSGRESQDAIATLMKIYRETGDKKYLEPIPRALEYLRKSLLADGRLARYYELQTNRPLYMNRHGEQYFLTYDDTDLPDHYGWKTPSFLDALEAEYRATSAGSAATATPSTPTVVDEAEVRKIITALDAEGRWLSTYQGEGLVGQPKFKVGEHFLSSEVFSRNVETLAAYLKK